MYLLLTLYMFAILSRYIAAPGCNDAVSRLQMVSKWSSRLAVSTTCIVCIAVDLHWTSLARQLISAAVVQSLLRRSALPILQVSASLHSFCHNYNDNTGSLLPRSCAGHQLLDALCHGKWPQTASAINDMIGQLSFLKKDLAQSCHLI